MGCPVLIARAAVPIRENTGAIKSRLVSLPGISQDHNGIDHTDTWGNSDHYVSGKHKVKSFPDLRTSFLLEWCVSCIYLCMQNMPIVLHAYAAIMKIISACEYRQDGILQSDYILYPFPIYHQKIRHWSCNRSYSGKWVHLQALVCRIRDVYFCLLNTAAGGLLILKSTDSKNKI